MRRALLIILFVCSCVCVCVKTFRYFALFFAKRKKGMTCALMNGVYFDYILYPVPTLIALFIYSRIFNLWNGMPWLRSTVKLIYLWSAWYQVKSQLIYHISSDIVCIHILYTAFLKSLFMIMILRICLKCMSFLILKCVYLLF